MIRIVIAILMIMTLPACFNDRDWRTASRASAGIAPDPKITEEAILHVYGARAWGWRGWFAIHTWIAAKKSGEPSYTVYDVVGWREHRGLPVLHIRKDIPDRHWYGERPKLIREMRGPGVDQVIDAINEAVADYPWKHEYKAFPGPNSNTFTAWIGNRVPAIELDLPFTAIGSGYSN